METIKITPTEGESFIVHTLDGTFLGYLSRVSAYKVLGGEQFKLLELGNAYFNVLKSDLH